jgi:hypothetical protein
VDVETGAIVARMGGGDASIWVETPVAGIMVFVGRGAGPVEGATDTDMSQAMATRMNREISKRLFFTIILCMVRFPFVLDHIQQE